MILTFPNRAGVAQFDLTSDSLKGTDQPATTESKTRKVMDAVLP